jgi:hypothetical protein
LTDGTKGVLTIAVGKKYITQARYLAFSCILNSPHTLRAVITDKPEILKHLYDIVIPYEESFGQPFLLKTRIYLHTPFYKTLYIDADSLVIKNIDSYWETLNHCPFVYSGTKITCGTWYFNITETMKKMNLAWIPKFNSGMFLFLKTKSAASIFEEASMQITNYKGDEIAFFRKNMLPDEPFFAMDIKKNAIEPFNDYHRFSRTLILASNIKINVTKGFAFYIKDGIPVFPLIVHFCGRFGNIFYFFEKLKLNLFFFSPMTLFNNFFVLIRNTLYPNKIKGEL